MRVLSVSTLVRRHCGDLHPRHSVEPRPRPDTRGRRACDPRAMTLQPVELRLRLHLAHAVTRSCLRVRSALADVTAGTCTHGTALSRALGRTRVAAVRATHAHMTKDNSQCSLYEKIHGESQPGRAHAHFLYRACDVHVAHRDATVRCMRLCGVICRWVGG